LREAVTLARHPSNLPRKKRTREHVLADLGANHVEKVALGCGHAVDRVWHDYGLDLALYTFDPRGYLESGVVWIQVKSSDRPSKRRDGSAVLVRLQRRDLLAWIADIYTGNLGGVRCPERAGLLACDPG